jgi:hypothetical protein
MALTAVLSFITPAAAGGARRAGVGGHAQTRDRATHCSALAHAGHHQAPLAPADTHQR